MSLCNGLISFISIASKFICIGPGVGLSGLRFHPSLVDTGLSVLSNMPITTLHRELSSRKNCFGVRISGTYCVDWDELAANPSLLLPLLPKRWSYRCASPCLVHVYSFDNLLNSPSAGPLTSSLDFSHPEHWRTSFSLVNKLLNGDRAASCERDGAA